MCLLDTPCMLETVPFWMLAAKVNSMMSLPIIMSVHIQIYPDSWRYKQCLDTINRKHAVNQSGHALQLKLIFPHPCEPCTI